MLGSKTLLVAAVLVAAGGTAIAQTQTADRNEPVRVYTNADLERLEPIPTQPANPPTPEEVAQRWEFVQSVLDEAYARIDADRRHALDRRLTESRTRALDRVDSTPDYVLPYSYGYWRVGVPAPHGRGDGLRKAASLLWDPPNAALFRPITPIHARPYQNNLFRLESRVAGSPVPGRRPGRPRP